MNKPLIIATLLLSKGFATFAAAEIAVIYNQQTGYVEISCDIKALPTNTLATLQRSSNNTNWQDLHAQKIKINRTFSVTDRNPQLGKMYYRLKFNSNLIVSYSNTSFVFINEPTDDWKVYPNPVTDVLIMQYKGVSIHKGLYNVYVFNSHNNIVARMRFASNQRTLKIPVSNLTKGIYVVQIFVEAELVAYEPFSKL